MLATINGYAIRSATVSMPARGRWQITAAINADAIPTGPLTFAAPGMTLVGTMSDGGTWAADSTLRIVGGAGGLDRDLPAKSYRRALLRHVLADLMSETGEKLSPTIDAGLLNTHLEHWTRARGTGGNALSAIVDVLGTSWRVLDDGTIEVGTPSFNVLDFDHQLIDDDPSAHRLTLVSAEATLRPGVTLRGADGIDRRLVRVEHVWSGEAVRTHAEYRIDGVQDKLRAAVGAVTRSIVRKITDYLTHYSGRIVGQAADGSVAIKLDGADMAGSEGIPIRYGIPGVRAKVPNGTRAHVTYSNGDPRKPIVTSFEPGALTELSFDGGTSPVARVDDTTANGSIAITAAPSGANTIVTFTYSPPTGPPQLATLTIPGTVTAAGVPLALKGKIDSGAPKILA